MFSFYFIKFILFCSSPFFRVNVFPSDTPAIAQARVDWRGMPTAHVFMADVPGLRKEEVKVEIEDDRVL